jgi:hypothetical protein
LPEPDGPTNATISPGSMVIVMPSSAGVASSRKRTVTDCKVIRPCARSAW